MKVIFSHIGNPFANYVGSDYPMFTALSNYYIKQLGFETIFFGDETSLKDFKNIEFDYTEKLQITKLKYFPNCFWSGGKLLAIESMNEPCMHIDNDLFLTKSIPEDFLMNDIICFHDELFAMNNKWVQLSKLVDFFPIQPKQAEGIPSISYNCGIIGGQDLETIKKGIGIVFDFISNNASYIDHIYFKHKNNKDYKHFFHPSVLIEQIWLFQIFKFFGKQITPLVKITDWDSSFRDMALNTGYIHLMHKKDEFRKSIEKFLFMNNIKY